MDRHSASTGRRRWLTPALLLLLLAQVAIAAWRDSVTVDEAAHLPLGLYFWQTLDFEADPINPPLGRMLAALPVAGDGLAVDPELGRLHWRLANDFMQRHRAAYHWTFFKARWMTIWWLLLLAGLVYRFARELCGPAAAQATLFLFVLTPDLLAHGHLVTLDVLGALGFVATLYGTWRLTRQLSWSRAALLGLGLGLANAVKLWNVVLVPLVIALLAIHYWRSGQGRAVASRLAVAFAIALVILGASYAGSGLLKPWRAIAWHEGGPFAQVAKSLPGLRLPLPAPYLRGVDRVLTAGGESNAPLYFLAGKLSAEGWWYYHPLAFALKTPIALLILIGWGLFACCRQPRHPPHRRLLLFAGLPAAVVFAANMFFNSQPIGVRHVLVATTLLLIPAGAALAGSLAGKEGRRGERRRAGGLLLAGWLLVSTLAVAPRYLQFVNLMGGGANGGHRWLSDSNIDWGQDFLRLRDYAESRRLDRLVVVAASQVDPAVYGLPVAEGPSSPGDVLAVSSSFVVGRPYFTVQNGQVTWLHPGQLEWLQEMTPIDRVGSFFIYKLP